MGSRPEKPIVCKVKDLRGNAKVEVKEKELKPEDYVVVNIVPEEDTWQQKYHLAKVVPESMSFLFEFSEWVNREPKFVGNDFFILKGGDIMHDDDDPRFYNYHVDEEEYLESVMDWAEEGREIVKKYSDAYMNLENRLNRIREHIKKFPHYLGQYYTHYLIAEWLEGLAAEARE